MHARYSSIITRWSEVMGPGGHTARVRSSLDCVRGLIAVRLTEAGVNAEETGNVATVIAPIAARILIYSSCGLLGPASRQGGGRRPHDLPAPARLPAHSHRSVRRRHHRGRHSCRSTPCRACPRWRPGGLKGPPRRSTGSWRPVAMSCHARGTTPRQSMTSPSARANARADFYKYFPHRGCACPRHPGPRRDDLAPILQRAENALADGTDPRSATVSVMRELLSPDTAFPGTAAMPVRCGSGRPQRAK